MIKNIMTSLVTAVLVTGVSSLGLWIALYPAEIGYGGDVWPFFIGAFSAVLIAFFALSAWYAAHDSSGVMGGMAVITVLLGLAAGLTFTITKVNTWEWSQFWLGTIELVILAAATAVVYVHKKL